MAKNLIQDGKSITVTAPKGGVASGGLVVIGLLVGVAITAAAEGEPVAINTEGVWQFATAAQLKAGDAAAVSDKGEVIAAAEGTVNFGVSVSDAEAGLVNILLK